ncbi:hypothetical protein PROFUN_11021 [Planoprotostelium fungivorum]|uniref:GATA-type domain-containing protein n=1 Tax=Planoprotostelium fungivorum TaxID=1890364 RepID=A0A2P6NBS9_9EUKA|nr:hypothetical protein PROFUN_11021 [Planoprotostelium fungivorum]
MNDLSLPSEILCNIIRFLPLKEIIRAESVSSWWRNAIRNNYPLFEQEHLLIGQRLTLDALAWLHSLQVPIEVPNEKLHIIRLKYVDITLRIKRKTSGTLSLQSVSVVSACINRSGYSCVLTPTEFGSSITREGVTKRTSLSSQDDIIQITRDFCNVSKEQGFSEATMDFFRHPTFYRLMETWLHHNGVMIKRWATKQTILHESPRRKLTAYYAGASWPSIFIHRHDEMKIRNSNDVELRFNMGVKTKERVSVRIVNHLCPGDYVQAADFIIMVYYAFESSSFSAVQQLLPGILKVNRNTDGFIPLLLLGLDTPLITRNSIDTPPKSEKKKEKKKKKRFHFRSKSLTPPTTDILPTPPIPLKKMISDEEALGYAESVGALWTCQSSLHFRTPIMKLMLRETSPYSTINKTSSGPHQLRFHHIRDTDTFHSLMEIISEDNSPFFEPSGDKKSNATEEVRVNTDLVVLGRKLLHPYWEERSIRPLLFVFLLSKTPEDSRHLFMVLMPDLELNSGLSGLRGGMIWLKMFQQPLSIAASSYRVQPQEGVFVDSETCHRLQTICGSMRAAFTEMYAREDSQKMAPMSLLYSNLVEMEAIVYGDLSVHRSGASSPQSSPCSVQSTSELRPESPEPSRKKMKTEATAIPTEHFPTAILIPTTATPSKGQAPTLLNSERKRTRRARAKASPDARTLSCRACGETKTCEWRRGPDGFKSLCNACGIHYAKIVRKEESIASSYVPKLIGISNLLS